MVAYVRPVGEEVKANIKNVHAIIDGNRRAIGWETDNARFHVWVDFEGPTSVLYKKPFSIQGRDFNTRQLRADAAANKTMIAAVLRIADHDKLMEKAEAPEREKQAEQRRKWVEQYRTLLVQERGPELLDALRNLVEWPDNKQAIAQAVALITRIDMKLEEFHL